MGVPAVTKHGADRDHGPGRRAGAFALGLVRVVAGLTFVVVAAVPAEVHTPGWVLLVGLAALLVSANWRMTTSATAG